MYMWRDKIGVLFGASWEVNMEVARTIPIFLVSVPFVAIARITISSFYASKTVLAYYILILACTHVDLYTAFALSVWWSDHDLVEYSVCANLISLPGMDHESICG